MRSPAARFVHLWIGSLMFALVCAPAWAGSSGKITGVRLDPDGKRVVIASRGDLGKHTARVIGQPNRLFIDFERAELGKVPRRLKGGRHGITEIRAGYYKSRARVVLDFGATPVPGFQIKREKGRVLVVLGKSLAKELPGQRGVASRAASRKPSASSPLSPSLVPATAGPSATTRKAPQLLISQNQRGLKALSSRSSGAPKGASALKKQLQFAQNRPTRLRDLSGPSSGNRSVRTGSGGNDLPSVSGRGARAVREVRPPVTPPTPDPRLIVQEITELKFTQVGHNSRLIIRGGDHLDYRMTKVSPTKLRIDLINAEIPKVHQKPLRTDRFSTSVEMIVPGSQTIFVQLKDAVPYQVQKKKGVLMLDFPPPRLALTPSQATRIRPGDQAGRSEYDRRRGEATDRRRATLEMREEWTLQENETRQRQIRSTEKELEESLKERREIDARYRLSTDPEVFSKPVTMDFQGISLRNAFRLLAEQAGVNIILGGGVRGTTTMRLFQVPMGQVMDTILAMHGLDRELIGNVMRIDRRGSIRNRRRARARENRRLITAVNRRISQARTRITRLREEREAALRQLEDQRRTAEAPVEDVTRTETIGATETIQIDGEPVTLVLVTIRLSYARASAVRQILQCVFNRRCPGVSGQGQARAQDEEQRRFEEYLSSQGFTPDSPGGRSRLLTWRRDNRGERRVEALEQVTERTTAERAIGALRGVGMDPRMRRILAHTVMWANNTYNTLYVKDIPERIEEMKKLIATLDIPRPECMIEARLVIANRNWSRSLGVMWGGRMNQRNVPHSAQHFWGLTANQQATGANAATAATIPGNNLPSTFLINLPNANYTGANSIPGIGAQFGLLAADYITELDARLQMGEASGLTKTILRPKVQVQDRQSASIRNGVQIPYTTVSADGTQTQLVNVDLSLTVTPTIYPDGRILLRISLTNDEPGDVTAAGQEINRQSASTTLVVKDGETAVIGGILTKRTSSTREGLPPLMNIPLVNYFFNYKNRRVIVEELLVFMTPTIVKKPPTAS